MPDAVQMMARRATIGEDELTALEIARHRGHVLIIGEQLGAIGIGGCVEEPGGGSRTDESRFLSNCCRRGVVNEPGRDRVPLDGIEYGLGAVGSRRGANRECANAARGRRRTRRRAAVSARWRRECGRGRRRRQIESRVLHGRQAGRVRVSVQRSDLAGHVQEEREWRPGACYGFRVTGRGEPSLPRTP